MKSFKKFINEFNDNSLGKIISINSEAIKNFWNWFGNSKVVDEKGRPEVCYHGSDKEFDEFDLNYIGKRFNYDLKGIFFTNNFKTARSYAFTDDQRSDLSKRMQPDIRKSASDRVKHVYLKIENPLTKTIIINHKEFKKTQYYDVVDFFDNNRDLINKLSFSYDGIIIRNINAENLYVVFNPNQIKSINNMTFSLNSNKITESLF